MSYETRDAFEHDFGKRITNDAGGDEVMAHMAHLQWSAEEAAAADADAVLALTNLGAEAQEITTGLTDPPCARNVQIDGNVSGITGDVTVYGTNEAGDEIEETLAANGTTNVVGSKAFKTVTQVDLPVQVHTPAAQTETIEVTAAVNSEADGNVTLAITAAILGEASPKEIVVALTDALDDVTKVAAALVDAINADEDVSTYFEASNEAGVITLTALTPLANDATLAIALTDTDTTGVTVGSSTNGTAGVPYDMISVGFGDKLGLPYMLSHNTVIAGQTFLDNTVESTEPTVVTDADELEKNIIDLNSALDGSVVDTYLIV